MAPDDRPADGSAWSTEQLQRFEQRLVDERTRAVAEMGQRGAELAMSLEAATGELSTWRFHMADIGSETYEREQSFLLASREGQLLWHIDQALRRLYGAPGTFGICEQCGNRIGAERLEAIPYVTRCVDCKQNWESGAGGPAAS